MSQRLDLHLHTTASDGTWDIDTLLTNLREKGIGIFSVTDHDDLTSTQALWDRRDTLPERFIPGIEVSVTHAGQEYHLTCYAFDPHNEDMQAISAENRRRRDVYNHDLIVYAAEQYEEISVEDYEAYIHERTRGGWKALWYLLDRRIIEDKWDFFPLMMRRGVPMVFPSPEETIARLHRAGARVMLAHPKRVQAGADEGGRSEHLGRNGHRRAGVLLLPGDENGLPVLYRLLRPQGAHDHRGLGLPRAFCKPPPGGAQDYGG